VLAGYVLLVFGVDATMTWAGADPAAGPATDPAPVVGTVQ
jgi:hypothetical protein